MARNVLNVSRSELDETSGSRNLSRISQQPTRIKTLAEVAKANAEMKRVERLKREIDAQQAKFTADKARFRKAKRQWEEEKRALTAKQKRRANQLSRTASIQNQQSLSQNSEEVAELKKKLERTAKQNRVLRQKTHELEQTLERVQKRARATARSAGGQGETETEKIRQMRRDVDRLKQNLKKALNQVTEEKQWYRAATHRIKRKQDQWLREQRLALTENNTAIKYMFVDDVKRIKIYTATNQIAVAGSGGEAMLDRTVRVRNVDGSDVFTPRASAAPDGATDGRRPAFDFSALMANLNELESQDDSKEEEIENGKTLADAIDAIAEMVSEMEARSRDLDALRDVVLEGDTEDFVETLTTIQERQQDLVEFLKLAFEEEVEGLITDLTRAGDGYTTNLRELLPYLQRSTDKATFGRDEIQQELTARVQDVIVRTTVDLDMEEDRLLNEFTKWEIDLQDRHRGQSEQLRTVNEEQKDDEANELGLVFIESIEQDFEGWRTAMKSLSKLCRNQKDTRLKMNGYKEEMSERIRDLESYKAIQDDDDPEAIQDQVVDLLESISDRHGRKEAEINDMEENDSAYRDIMNLLLDKSAQVEMKQAEDIWWLAQDEDRTIRFTNMAETQDVIEDSHLISFLERLLNDDPDLSTVYIPMHQHTDKYGEPFVLMMSCFDAVLVVTLLNKLREGFIDVRALHKPDPFNLQPLTDQQIRENVALLISTIHAENIDFPPGTKVVDWFDTVKFPILLNQLLREIGKEFVNKLVSLKDIPELSRLTKDDEEARQIRSLNGFDWMHRWVNSRCGRDVMDDIVDWNSDLCRVVASLNPAFDAETISGLSPHDVGSEILVAVKRLGVQTVVSAGDLSHGNILCQHLLAAEILSTRHGMERLTDDEKERYAALFHASHDLEDNMYAGWINAMGLDNVHIQNLEEELADGVILLKLIDRVKPGIVKWRKKVVNAPSNKFEKLENASYALNICTNTFNIPTHTMEPNDIVEGNEKVIHSLLWFIMRYHATKSLSQLQFGGEEVTDELILHWANETCSRLEYKNSKQIRGFRDKSLTTGLFYLDLLRAVVPEAVNEDLIYDSIPVLDLKKKKVVVEDEFASERMANVRYAMTIIRLHGEDLFVIPDHVLELDSHACLSILCAIMTIDAKKKLKLTRTPSDFEVDRTKSYKDFMGEFNAAVDLVGDD